MPVYLLLKERQVLYLLLILLLDLVHQQFGNLINMCALKLVGLFHYRARLEQPQQVVDELCVREQLVIARMDERERPVPLRTPFDGVGLELYFLVQLVADTGVYC